MYNEKRELSSFVEDYIKVTENLGVVWYDNVIPMNFKYLNDKESVEVLDLSTRSRNALKRSGVATIGQLCEKLETLSKVKNLGRLSVKEIKTRFCEYYYDSLSGDQREEFWKCAIKENEKKGEVA